MTESVQVHATRALDLADKVSIAFVFAGTFPGFEQNAVSLDFEQLDSDRGKSELRCAYVELRETYVRPIEAFIDDICDQNTAGMHFPLIMQLTPEPDTVKNVVNIHFPKTFDYSAEGRDVRVSEIRERARCQFRESFALFETGRFYYTICFC